MNCRQIESLVIAIKKGYRILNMFAHFPDVRSRVAPPSADCATSLCQGDHVCDWYIPFVSTYAVLYALKSNRSPYNEASLVAYLSAGEVMRGA